ncbi:MAG: hypothetical protein V3T60_07230, partial [Candidatus Binatia bacterium]
MSNHTISLPQAIPATWALSSIIEWLSRPVNLFFVLVAAVLAYLSLFPTFFIFFGRFSDEPLGVSGTLTLNYYYEAYVEEPAETLSMLSNSLIFAFASSTFSILIA